MPQPARMPEELINQPKRLVSNMVVGESAFVLFSAVIVKQETHETFLRSNAELLPFEGSLTVGIQRTEDGIILILRTGEYTYDDRFWILDEIPKTALPVLEIKVG